MNTAFLLLGSNLGDRYETFRKAIHLIEKNIGKVVQKSTIQETEAWGFKSNNLFLNQAIAIDTKLQPVELLRSTQQIEKQLGRKTKTGNTGYTSREIDIDILLYNNEVVQTNELYIPHKLMHKRKFVLNPLCEIAAGILHPVLKKTIAELNM